jgi:hypothetical protein
LKKKDEPQRNDSRAIRAHSRPVIDWRPMLLGARGAGPHEAGTGFAWVPPPPGYVVLEGTS